MSLGKHRPSGPQALSCFLALFSFNSPNPPIREDSVVGAVLATRACLGVTRIGHPTSEGVAPSPRKDRTRPTTSPCLSLENGATEVKKPMKDRTIKAYHHLVRLPPVNTGTTFSTTAPFVEVSVRRPDMPRHTEVLVGSSVL